MDMPHDLVVLSVGGVQRFIAEARRTADMAGPSAVVHGRARRAVALVEQELTAAAAPCGLIFPAAVAASVTDKIVFLVPEKAGTSTRDAVKKIDEG